MSDICFHTLGFLGGYCKQELPGSEAESCVLLSVHTCADCPSAFFQETRQHEALPEGMQKSPEPQALIESPLKNKRSVY